MRSAALLLLLTSPLLAGDPIRLDLAGDAERQTVVDRETGQYLGHPSTLLLEDGKTILCVYPKGHGRGAIVYKRSTDGGRTWSERLPTPENWATSKETPTLFPTVDGDGTKRIVMFEGLRPARRAVSEDDGETWSPLEPIGGWGGIVVMGDVARVADAPGGKPRYLAWFHDDGRFFEEGGRRAAPVVFTLYQTESTDGGLTWAEPRAIRSGSAMHLCEPGLVRSPGGREIALLLRENSRRRPSQIIRSTDDGQTWSDPEPLREELTGDRHQVAVAEDGRLIVSYRRRSPGKLDRPFDGDWVAWVGRYDQLTAASAEDEAETDRPLLARLMDNTRAADCAYPGVERLPGGTFVLTTYGHWTAGEPPYIVSVRFTLAELDALADENR